MSFSFGSLLSIGGMIVGGIVGSLIYPGVGTSIGIALGAALGGLVGMTLFPDQQKTNRVPPPQPRENRQQISTYGAPIPITYGTVRLAGNIIYMSDVKETLSVYKYRVEGQRVRDYTRLYTATFAVAFCEGPVAGIARIWINGKLFVDFRDPAGPYYPSGSMSLAQGNIDTSLARKEVYFSIHWGDEDQDPDATLVTLLGSGNVPAYRGLFYIVFPDFPVGEFGGVPTIEVELGAIDEIVAEAANPKVLPPQETFEDIPFSDWSELDPSGVLTITASEAEVSSAGNEIYCRAAKYYSTPRDYRGKKFRVAFTITGFDDSTGNYQDCTILLVQNISSTYQWVMVVVGVQNTSFSVILKTMAASQTQYYTGIMSWPRSKLLELSFPEENVARLKIFNSSYSEQPEATLEQADDMPDEAADWLAVAIVNSLSASDRGSLSIKVQSLQVST